MKSEVYRLALLVTHIIIAFGDQNATYMCFYDGVTKRIDMSIVEGPNEPDILKVFGYLHGVECDITNNATRFSVIINGTVPTCGITNGTTANPGGSGYQLTATTSSAAGAITATDARYTINCEFDVINTEISITIDPTVIGNGIVATGTAIVEAETVSLGIIDSTGSPASSVNFGDPIKLQAILTKRGIAGAATGISIHDCSAVNNLVAPTKTVNMFDARGCTTPGLGLYPENMGFTVSSNTATSYKTDSVSFNAFIMSDGTSTLAFRCNASFCYLDDSSCDTSCNPSVRRKRDVDEIAAPSTEMTREVVAILTVGGKHVEAFNGIKSNDVIENSKQEKTLTCSPQVNIAGMAILGAILALTVIVAIGFFVVIMKSRKTTSSTKHVVS